MTGIKNLKEFLLCFAALICIGYVIGEMIVFKRFGDVMLLSIAAIDILGLIWITQKPEEKD